MNLMELKYPVGEYQYQGMTDELKASWINDIETFPAKISALVSGLSDEELNWKYRPDGWTIRQVVHHCSDSHMNAQLRFKLALTEERPTIKPYLEARWAVLTDIELNVSVSLQLLAALHTKWVYLLERLTQEELAKTYYHPEYEKTFDLNFTIGMYAWHCRHHLAHVKQAIEYRGEFK